MKCGSHPNAGGARPCGGLAKAILQSSDHGGRSQGFDTTQGTGPDDATQPPGCRLPRQANDRNLATHCRGRRCNDRRGGQHDAQLPCPCTGATQAGCINAPVAHATPCSTAETLTADRPSAVSPCRRVAVSPCRRVAVRSARVDQEAVGNAGSAVPAPSFRIASGRTEDPAGQGVQLFRLALGQRVAATLAAPRLRHLGTQTLGARCT